MDRRLLFNFQSDISGTDIPEKLNNPFGSTIPEIAEIAAKEFQQFILIESQKWERDFSVRKGKMFGVLVVEKEDKSVGYLGTISGKISNHETCKQFIPPVFDDSINDFFLYEGMTELTEIGNEIKKSNSPSEIAELKKIRSEKSMGLQQRLFENSIIQNHMGVRKNVLQIFESSSHGSPPSAAGECAAPKLLQHAFKHQLRPIALAEFWWGTRKNKEREHMAFYPSCKNKCRPILEYMLGDKELFNQVSGSEN